MGRFTDEDDIQYMAQWARDEQKARGVKRDVVDEEFKRLVIQGFSVSALCNYFELAPRKVLRARAKLFPGWELPNVKEKLKVRKREKGCWLCGHNQYAEILHFHHPNDNKVEDVMKMAKWEWQEERIWREMRKCVVLCNNCHFLLHMKRFYCLLPVDLDKYWN